MLFRILNINHETSGQEQKCLSAASNLWHIWGENYSLTNSGPEVSIYSFNNEFLQHTQYLIKLHLRAVWYYTVEFASKRKLYTTIQEVSQFKGTVQWKYLDTVGLRLWLACNTIWNRCKRMFSCCWSHSYYHEMPKCPPNYFPMAPKAFREAS